MMICWTAEHKMTFVFCAIWTEGTVSISMNFTLVTYVILTPKLINSKTKSNKRISKLLNRNIVKILVGLMN